MSESHSTSARLTRLLGLLQQDAGNLALRKDAIREACRSNAWDTAGTLLDDGMRDHPLDAELFAHSAFVLLHSGYYEEAEQALLVALSLGVSEDEPRYNLAYALFMQKRYADALKEIEVKHEWPTVPLARLLRARCLHHLERTDEAIEECRAYLAVVPDDAAGNGLAALLFQEKGARAEARRHADAALAGNPTQLEALLALGALQSEAEEYDEAFVSYRTLLDAHPSCGRAWLGLGLIELTQMHFESARRDLEQATVWIPDHIGTWHVLAWIRIMMNDVAGAEQAFQRALAIDRNFSETHGGLAVIAAMQGRDAEAWSGIERATRLDPRSMSAPYAEILLLQRYGQHAEANAVLERFLARPAGRDTLQYRDLITTHLKSLRSQVERASGSRLRH